MGERLFFSRRLDDKLHSGWNWMLVEKDSSLDVVLNALRAETYPQHFDYELIEIEVQRRHRLAKIERVDHEYFDEALAP